jgi:hypothetical protein
MISENTFKNTDPGGAGVGILLSGSMAIGLTISTQDCGGDNFQQSLSQLADVTLAGVNNGDPIYILNREVKTNYYYFQITPFTHTTPLAGVDCTVTSFNPFIESIGFKGSDFDIIFNNASSPRESRYIQDVDRKNDAIKPSNVDNLLLDTAIKASTPDSNYTSLANTSGRYIGTKTSITTYGVDAAIAGTLFKGGEYLLSTANTNICSQSIAERVINDFLFSKNSLVIENTEYPTVVFEPLYTANNATVTLIQTDLTLNENLDIKVGDVLKYGINTYEYVEVISVSHPNASTTYLQVNREYYREFDPNMGNYSVSNNKFTLTRVLGDSIYKTDSSKIYKLVNKKLWVSVTDTVVIVDKNSKVIINATICNI